ncbi:MAG: class I SAM-dependent methyltransferase [Actinobacteria bacterium]|nr:class I SAM-dependent methyltransferase [Actinomycetota bacterium]
MAATRATRRPACDDPPVQGFDPSTYGESFADVYDDWYGDISDIDATVALVAAMADGGPVLELGIGTGRLALPLAATGLEVHGIDASPAMVERLRAKPGGDAIPVALGDFADVGVSVPGGFAVVLAAYNTLFNLASAAAQRRCVENVARRLRPGGAFVVEAFVPGPEPDTPTGAVAPSVIDADRVVLQVTRRDPATQTVDGSIISITEAGIRLRPWHIRYTRPDELDDMAAGAGLTLALRHGGWHGQPFADDSSHHVSVYRRAGGGGGGGKGRPAPGGDDAGPNLGRYGGE